MTEPTTTGNIYTYRRISHAEQRSGSASLQWQEQAITQWLNARGRCREDDFVNDGASAGISLEGDALAGPVWQTCQPRLGS